MGNDENAPKKGANDGSNEATELTAKEADFLVELLLLKLALIRIENKLTFDPKVEAQKMRLQRPI